MLANETTQKSSKSTEPRMKDGEEPTEVLLALVSSPLLALKERGIVKIMTAKDTVGKPVLLAMFVGYELDQSVGIVPAKDMPTLPTETKEEAGE